MEKIKLGDLCKPSAGQIKEDEDTLIDYIDISSVDNETKKVTGYQTITFGEAPSRARKAVRRGNVLVSTVRPNLNAVALLEEDTPNVSVASTGFCVLESKDDVDPRFILNFCKSKPFIDDMVSQATGASYPAVSDKIVRSALVPNYSYQEQQHISTVLDKLAGIIDDRRIELQQLDDLIKARFVELFGDPLDGTAKYPIHQVGDVAEAVDPQPSHRTPPVEEGGIPYVSIKDCDSKTGMIDFEGARKVSRKVLEEHLDRYTLHEGDFVIGKIGTIGNPIFVPARNDYTLSANVVLVQPNTELVSAYYLKYAFESAFVERQFSEAKNSTSQAAFGIQKVRTIELMNPDIEIQRGFESFAKQVDKSKVV